MEGRVLYNSTYKNYKDADCYISKVVKEAYKYKYLISNPVISRSPDSSNLIKNICCNTELYSSYSNFNLILKVIKYYFNSSIHILVFITHHICYKISRLKFNKKNINYDDELVIISTFTMIDKIYINNALDDKYFGYLYKILEDNNIKCDVIPADIDEDEVKNSLIAEGANPLLISKNLAELKSIKISKKISNRIVLGADSVINLDGMLISKPKNREEALQILKKLNGKKHNLTSSVCISKDGSMMWNYTDSSTLTMKKLSLEQLERYLSRIKDKFLYSYGVYQIEAEGRSLFLKIEGDENTIMGLPVKQIKDYLNNLK